MPPLIAVFGKNITAPLVIVNFIKTFTSFVPLRIALNTANVNPWFHIQNGFTLTNMTPSYMVPLILHSWLEETLKTDSLWTILLLVLQQLLNVIMTLRHYTRQYHSILTHHFILNIIQILLLHEYCCLMQHPQQKIYKHIWYQFKISEYQIVTIIIYHNTYCVHKSVIIHIISCLYLANLYKMYMFPPPKLHF